MCTNSSRSMIDDADWMKSVCRYPIAFGLPTILWTKTGRHEPKCCGQSSTWLLDLAAAEIDARPHMTIIVLFGAFNRAASFFRDQHCPPLGLSRSRVDVWSAEVDQ